jgi:hypothetical protein
MAWCSVKAQGQLLQYICHAKLIYVYKYKDFMPVKSFCHSAITMLGSTEVMDAVHEGKKYKAIFVCHL